MRVFFISLNARHKKTRKNTSRFQGLEPDPDPEELTQTQASSRFLFAAWLLCQLISSPPERRWKERSSSIPSFVPGSAELTAGLLSWRQLRQVPCRLCHVCLQQHIPQVLRAPCCQQAFHPAQPPALPSCCSSCSWNLPLAWQAQLPRQLLQPCLPSPQACRRLGCGCLVLRLPRLCRLSDARTFRHA